MATCPSTLAWEVPWTEEPGGLQSTGSEKNWTQLRSQTTTKSYMVRRLVNIQSENLTCLTKSSRNQNIQKENW